MARAAQSECMHAHGMHGHGHGYVHGHGHVHVHVHVACMCMLLAWLVLVEEVRERSAEYPLDGLDLVAGVDEVSAQDVQNGQPRAWPEVGSGVWVQGQGGYGARFRFMFGLGFGLGFRSGYNVEVLCRGFRVGSPAPTVVSSPHLAPVFSMAATQDFHRFRSPLPTCSRVGRRLACHWRFACNSVCPGGDRRI